MNNNKSKIAMLPIVSTINRGFDSFGSFVGINAGPEIIITSFNL